jgi:hypothetical protein
LQNGKLHTDRCHVKDLVFGCHGYGLCWFVSDFCGNSKVTNKPEHRNARA